MPNGQRVNANGFKNVEIVPDALSSDEGEKGISLGVTADLLAPIPTNHAAQPDERAARWSIPG